MNVNDGGPRSLSLDPVVVGHGLCSDLGSSRLARLMSRTSSDLLAAIRDVVAQGGDIAASHGSGQAHL